MEKVPKVSIIMAAYNSELYISQAINSILEQSFHNFELIIIDDASTDSTYEIIRNFADDRIKIIRNKQNKKLAFNLNKGISVSRGEYIARMDADDICDKDRLKIQVNYLDNNKEVEVVGTWGQAFGENNNLLTYPLSHEEIKVGLLFENQLCHPSVMFRKSINGLQYLVSCKAGQDYELWSRLIWNHKFANIGMPLLNYRVHSAQTKYTQGAQQKEGAFLAQKNMLKHLDESFDDSWIRKFCRYSNHNERKNKNELIEYEEMMDCINAINDKKNIFDRKLLLKYCNELYFRNWYLSSTDKSISIRTLKQSKYSELYSSMKGVERKEICLKYLLKKIIYIFRKNN